MKNAESPMPATLERRGFCGTVAGWIASLVFVKFPQAPGQVTKQEFLVVNGWVLTREDIAGSAITHHVVQL